MGRRSSNLISYISYDNRAQLRTTGGATGALRQIEDLGVFMFISGLTEPDDDETCFATPSGAWILQSPSMDVIDAFLRPELEEVQNDVSVLQNQIQRVTSEQNGILQQQLTRTVVLFDSERDLAQPGTNTNNLQLMWRDIGILDPSKIVTIELLPVTLATTGSTYFYVYPVNEYGNVISGTWGGQSMGFYGGGAGYTQLNNTQVSGSSLWYFPCYSSVYPSGGTYGSGLTGNIIWSPKTFNDNSSAQPYYGSVVSGTIGYQQSTSYSYPNGELFAWDNQGTSAIGERPMGFRFNATSGVFRQGSLTVRITYRP